MVRTTILACRLALVGALLLGGITPMASAQNPPPGETPQATPNWETIKKDADAEKAALDAKKQLLDARKALEAAEAPPDLTKKALDDKLAAAKAAKDLADAEKAAADARKAQADAALAAFKAKVGEVPASGYTGGVTLKEKAGIIEAALLAAKAVKTAAQRIVDALPQQPAKKIVVLYSAAEIPNFQALIVFRAQIALVNKGFADAQKASNDADRKAPVPPDFKLEFVPPAAAAGLTLEAVNKLLAFFRTDYTVGGVDLTSEDSLLVHALAGLIAGSNKNLDVQLPAVYSPGALSDAGSGILNDLTTLSLLKTGAQDKANRHDKFSARFTEDAGKEADPEKKAALLDGAKTHKAAADTWKAAIGLYDSFFSKLTTVDDKGVAPLANVIREGVVADVLLKDNLLLLVKLQKFGGAYYTKKNMLTLFGGMPFFHMGGVVASFVLLDGKAGTVQGSGVIPVHGGFVKASDLSQRVNED